MKIVELSIRQPITITVGVILSLLAGFIAFDRVPIQMTPTIEDTVISVSTMWPNASPQEIESEIIEEQEEKLQSVTNLVSMTSISQRGQGQIRLEFRTGTDKDVALREVSNKLREVPDYPENVDEPVIEDTDPESQDYIAWVVVACSNPDFDVTTLFDAFDKRLKPQFERLPGVAEVNVLGGRERETQIQIDPTAMALHNITYSQFENVIRNANVNFSGGELQEGKSNIRVRVLGRFDMVDKILNTVIARNGAGPVYVKDVAKVVETYKEQLSFVRSRGNRVMAINFQREIGSNVLDVMEEVQQQIDNVNQPDGLLDVIANEYGVNGELQLIQVYDQTEYINMALSLVQENILIGGGLATITLLLFLRSLRTIGIIAVAIPISIITSIVVLYALGRTVNVISLAGMAFAVGMVVDNSIVVLENIYRHLEMGKTVRQASYTGAAEVGKAVMASTLTTLIVFVPILLIEESAGQLFRDIALAICAAVGLSFIVAITVIPSASSLFLKDHNGKPNHSEKKKKKRFFGLFSLFGLIHNIPQKISGAFIWLSHRLILRLILVIIIITLTAGGIYLLVPPIDYLPTGNRNIVFGIMIPPPGYNLDMLSQVGDRIEERIQPFWEASHQRYEFDSIPEDQQKNEPQIDPNDLPIVPVMGAPEGTMVQPPPVDNYFFVASAEGRMFHGGISADPEKVVDLISLFNYATAPELTPGIISFAVQLPLFRIGGSTGTAVNIHLVGPDLTRVRNAAGALYGSITGEFGMRSIQPEPNNFNIPSPELQIYPDLLALADLDLSVRDLGLAVQASSDGAFIGEYDLETERIDLTLISQHASQYNTLEDMGGIPLATPGGRVVRLETVAKLARVTEPDQIKRVGRQRAVTLQFTPPTGMPLENAIVSVNGMVRSLREQNAITPDIDIQLAGSASKLNEMQVALLGDGTWGGFLTSSLFLALLVVYLLMCVLFQSWVYPMVIMLSVPLATFGGFLGLRIVHEWSMIDRYMPTQNMDVLTILGFVILAGVVVNNAILIVHQTLNFTSGRSESNTEGEIDPQHAISMAVESRVRPILMSTLSSVGGMLPLVIMPGAGSELYRGLGSVVVGGLLVSAFFTLLLVPLVLSLVFDLQKAMGLKPGESKMEDFH